MRKRPPCHRRAVFFFLSRNPDREASPRSENPKRNPQNPISRNSGIPKTCGGLCRLSFPGFRVFGRRLRRLFRVFASVSVRRGVPRRARVFPNRNPDREASPRAEILERKPEIPASKPHAACRRYLPTLRVPLHSGQPVQLQNSLPAFSPRFATRFRIGFPHFGHIGASPAAACAASRAKMCAAELRSTSSVKDALSKGIANTARSSRSVSLQGNSPLSISQFR